MRGETRAEVCNPPAKGCAQSEKDFHLNERFIFARRFFSRNRRGRNKGNRFGPFTDRCRGNARDRAACPPPHSWRSGSGRNGNMVGGLALYQGFATGVLSIVSPIAASYGAITLLLSITLCVGSARKVARLV